MTEAASDTSNHQRFDEMFIHLTPQGALIPYSVAFDEEDGVWIAAKGGLFKFHAVNKAPFDAPLGWEELVSSDEFAFQTLAIYDENTLIASTCSVPITIQTLRWIDVSKASVSKGFSEAGKTGGQIFFPRAMKRVGDEVIVMDKTGRFLRFDRQGEYKGLAAEIDAYLANGFTVEKGKTAVMVCSGVVLDQDKRTICDDWVEKIELDGSSWRTLREEKKTST